MIRLNENLIKKDWVQLNVESVDLLGLNEVTTVDLIDDWNNYREILILVGQTYGESTNVVIYPQLPKKHDVYCLNGLSNYQFYAYVGVGTNIEEYTNTRKCFCFTRETIGYDISTMKIFAVYGRK